MEEIRDSRSNVDKVSSFIRRFMDLNYTPYMLKTRGGGRSGISSATAYQVKLLVGLLPQLSPEELQQLTTMSYTNPRNNKLYQFAPYVQQIQRLAGVQQGKAEMKNISNDQQYSELIQNIRLKIEDFLKEQEAKIEKSMTENWQHIHDQYKNMSREDFAKKYGEKKTSHAIAGQQPREYYSLTMFSASYLGTLLRTRAEHLPAFIQKTQKAYRDKEYQKVDALIYKLKSRFPQLTNFLMTNFRKSIDGIEFTLSADSPEGKATIHTQTIYAGGYNIQRLHLRWLMHVTEVSGAKTKLEV